MSKWIDADALVTELEKDESLFDKEAEEARNNPSAYTDEYAVAMWSRANGIRDAMIEIHDAPSIDICFCRECKYRNYRIDYQMDYCIQHSKALYTTDGGCSWGKEDSSARMKGADDE